MMKNKTAKVVVNGVVLAAVAAIGVAAYQFGTSSQEEKVPQEIILESEETDQSAQVPEEEEPLVDAGTTQVEASMEADDSVVSMETDGEASGEEESGTAEETQSGESTDDWNDFGEETDTSEATASASILDFSEDTETEWPVNGNILLDYSMDQTTYFPTLDQYRMNPAIAVQAVEGAPVMAAAAGTVFSIEETAQTGTTVTMELGNGYQAIYGQLVDLTVSEGDTVSKGTIIGYINAPTKYYSKEGSNLYFAMKRNGEPIDPILYLP